MLTKRQIQAIETKHELIVCAMELFNENNYEKVTIKDICNKASLSVGAFYHYFDSKENIINESFKTFDVQLEENVSLQKFTSSWEAINYLIEQYLKSTSMTGYGVVNTIYRLEMINKEKYMIDKNRFLNRRLTELVKKGLEDGEFKSQLPPDEISDWIFRMVRGTIFDWCIHRGEFDLIQRGSMGISLIVPSLLEMEG